MKLPDPIVRPAAALAAAVAFTVSIWPISSAAQAITADGTLGTVVGNGGNDYTISGGTVKGGNLFHSFGNFSVPTFGSATFNGPDATQNVISRVTGGLASSIDGTISTRLAMPSANFFLINPAGIVLGPNTFLDVGGAVRISTADHLRLADDKIFSATPGPADALLTSAAPQAFGFLGNAPAPITADGAFLAVDPGQTLSLVGGDISVINGGILLALGGVVQLVSVASPGVVDLGAPDVSAFSRLGAVTISGPDLLTGISAGGTDAFMPGGTVIIRSGQLVVEGANALVISDTADFPGAAVGLDIQARDSMLVRDGAVIQTFSTGPGDASSISISAGNLTVSNGARIESFATAEGNTGAIDIRAGNAQILNGGVLVTNGAVSNAGDISITATGTVTLAGAGSEISTGAGGSSGDPDLPVLAGNISLAAADIVLQDEAQIRSGGLAGEQAGENMSVTATNTLSISGLAGISSQAFNQSAGTVAVSASQLMMDSGYINSSTLGTGGAGRIVVAANTVGLTNGAQISSSSQIVATGAGGAITITAPGSVTISGTGPADGVGSGTLTGNQSSGLFSTTEGSGNAGQISVSTPTLAVTGGGTISVATKGVGSAGSIVANVSSINVAEGSRIDSSTTAGGAGGGITVSASNVSISGTDTGLFSTASSSGGAGQIAVSGSNLAVTGGGRVDSSTSAGGTGGAITVNGTLSISGAGSGLFSTASSTGAAGAINATGPNLTVAGGGTIDSGTTGAGAGGAISLSAASQVEISSGGSVRADSLGVGNTGSIAIAAGDRIVMESGSISTRAATSDGGNITLTAPNIIKLGNSQITTSVQSGTGAGGNIFIDPQFVILTNSTISANAFGGPGGSVTIVADNFLTDSSSFVTASSALSTPGTVQIQSPDNNVASDIAQLPRELVDASRLLRGGCAARRTGAPSSFTVVGRGGVPLDPDGYLPSFSASGAQVGAAGGAAAAQGFALAMAGGDCWR